MTHPYTPAQLEAWAGLGPWEWCENWLYVANPNPPPGPVLWYTADDDGVHAEPNDAALIAAAPDLARLVLEKDKEIAALQAFKNYVHERLDKAGIPTHPDGEHSKAGCRIGDRLDIALAARQVMKGNRNETASEKS